jgi:hypothetical protein
MERAMAGRRPQDIPTAELMAVARAWRAEPTRPVACPACATVGLAIVDRSARPYREWYALSCTACGLARTVTVSLAAPIPGA